MSLLLSSHQQIELQPIPSNVYREEIIFSEADASRYNIRHGDYSILKTTDVIPDIPQREYAVRLIVSNRGESRSNTLAVGTPFFEELQFGLGQEWELHSANYQSILSLTLEPSVEQEQLRQDLKRLRRDEFTGRCLLIQPSQTVGELSLRMRDQAYFNIRDIKPSISNIRTPTVFSIEDHEHTEVNIFIPHRKGGIDMVIVVDASNSMIDMQDYGSEQPIEQRGFFNFLVNQQPKRLRRIEGVRQALETLLQQRLYSGSRVSHFALVAFGRNARIIYPSNSEEMVELTEREVETLRTKIRLQKNLTGLIDGTGSDIPEAMDLAATLLYKNARDDNEKIIILLSDGASWVEQKDTGSYQIEGRLGRDDPVMFADSLHYEGQIRIYTVAISNEENARKYEPERYQEDMKREKGQRVWIPNPDLLEKISTRTDGKFFSSPNAESLNKLFEDFGQGAVIPLK